MIGNKKNWFSKTQSLCMKPQNSRISTFHKKVYVVAKIKISKPDFGKILILLNVILISENLDHSKILINLFINKFKKPRISHIIQNNKLAYRAP